MCCVPLCLLHRYGLFALHWILEVNGQHTPDLDTFLNVVQSLKDGDFARVKVCHLETTQHKVRPGHTAFTTWRVFFQL